MHRISGQACGSMAAAPPTFHVPAMQSVEVLIALGYDQMIIGLSKTRVSAGACKAELRCMHTYGLGIRCGQLPGSYGQYVQSQKALEVCKQTLLSMHYVYRTVNFCRVKPHL
jgi:hypothetical protein